MEFLISKLYSNATNEFHDRNRYKKSSWKKNSIRIRNADNDAAL